MGFDRWLLLEGERNTVALGLVGLVFATLLVAGATGGLELASPGAVDTVAGGLVPGLFAFLSIVLAINQLVLSQEFGSAAEVRERVDRLRTFRRDVEEAADEAPSPVLPTGFLRLLAETIHARADALAQDAEHREPGPRDALAAFAADVAEEASQARARLAGTEAGRVGAVLAVLDYPDVDQLYRARSLADEHAGELGPAEDVLDELVEVLTMFSVARTHFRTNYTQRVLARLSRLLLYSGVPAILAAFTLSLLPAVLDPGLRVVLASALLALAFAPVALLSAYVLRIATVSERTLAAGPFRSRPR